VIRADDILKFLRVQPFRPFRITTTIGETYDIPHPEMAVLSQNIMAVGLPPKGKEDAEIAEFIVNLALMHIVKIEPLPKESKSRNGKGKHK
jgi:hypothetical protein